MAKLGLYTATEANEDDDALYEESERVNFVNNFVSSQQKGDAAPIKDFVSVLFSKLHKIYGKNTRINQNEFGGFDFRDG
jgi:ABC-type metal ion transport system substrate-binding protein